MSDGFGKYDVYAVAGSSYYYKDTNVLRNKLNIRDGALLRLVEADISMVRQTELMEHPVNGRFTVNHLCTIHKKLLSDVYSFAGHFRHENIAKGETRFLDYNDIMLKLIEISNSLRSDHYLCGMARNPFIERSAFYMAELNYIHPFREGNGRAIREYMRLLFLRNGYRVDWASVTVERLLEAMIDSVYDTTSLILVLNQCLKNI